MNKAILDFPTGDMLEREIESVEVSAKDELVRKTVTERLAIANHPDTVFVKHDDVFKVSQRRLLAKLADKENAK